MRWIALTLPLLALPAFAQQIPLSLAAYPDDQSVYAPPAPPREEDGVNAGGVNIDFAFRYMTDYVFRGIDQSEAGGSEDSPNLQFDGKISFNLGKFPHPFIGVFVNVYDSDPISRFQEIRPFFGIDWTFRPFELSLGNTTYIYPERDELNTGEVWARLTFDDSWIFKTNRRIFSPYALAAYDYDKYNGWYFEAGLKHELALEGTGLTLTAVASISYIMDHSYFSTRVGGKDSGLQHYQVGLIGSYSLNQLFQVSNRYGSWTLEGYVYYTDKTSSDLRADTQIWGGAGIGFKY